MTNHLNAFRTDLEKVHAANPSQAEIDSLKARINDKSITEADRVTANNELVAKLAASTPSAA